MTTTDHDDMDIEEIEALSAAATDILRRRISEIEHARDTQPERLAQARSDADVARGWALIEEPLSGQIKTIESIDGRASLALPNITAKELWGARLCFDLLDCGDHSDQIDSVISRLFSAAGGDPGVAMAILSAALSTIASLVVPQLLEEIEYSGSNYDERVRLAEARAKAWNARANDLRGTHDDAAAAGGAAGRRIRHRRNRTRRSGELSMSGYLSDGMQACRYCAAAAPYFVGMDGERFIEGQQHQRECPDAWPEECPF